MRKDTYEVERILDKRYMYGKLQYWVKWKNYPDDQNTWEPIANLTNCKDRIDEFERQKKYGLHRRASQRTTRSTRGRRRGSGRANSFVAEDTLHCNEDLQINTARIVTGETSANNNPWTSKEAETIIGATNETGEITFLIKFKGGENDVDIVPASQANQLWPQKVIEFYESRTRSWVPKYGHQ